MKPLNKLFSFLLLTLFLFSGPQLLLAQNPETILIGFNLSLSGPRSASGLSTQNGAELLKEELNQKGGIQVGNNRYPVEFIYGDNETQLEPAVKSALDLISKKKVLGIVGPNSSSRAIPVGGIAQSFKAPMVSPTSTNPKTTNNRPFVFRACFLDDFQGEVMSKFAIKEYKAQKAAVLFDIDSAYPRGLAEFFKKSFENMKGAGTVVAFESFQTDFSDLSAQIKSINQSGADVLFLPQYSNELPQILKQLRDGGWDKPIMGGDGWESSDLMENCGDLCKGLFFSAHFASFGAKGKSKEFVDNYTAKYSTPPDGYSALGYDAANLLITAISQLDSINPNIFTARNEIAQKLAAIKKFEGVSGSLNMNGSGDPAKSAVIIRITESGQFEAYASETP